MDDYTRAAARVHAALRALQAAPERARGSYADEFTRELYNARAVRKTHGLARMPFIATLTELIASCKPAGAYGLVPTSFARALEDVRGAPDLAFDGDLGPDQWWRALATRSAASSPDGGASTSASGTDTREHRPAAAGHAHARHPAHALSLSPIAAPLAPPPPPQSPPSPPPLSHGRKRKASVAQLDTRAESPREGGRGAGRAPGASDNLKFEMWTAAQGGASDAGNGAPSGSGSGSARGRSGSGAGAGGGGPAKYARYNPEDPGPPKGYELCTDEQLRCDRCRERGIECWKGRKRKRASGACWNCHKLKRPCSMAKDWFAAKSFPGSGTGLYGSGLEGGEGYNGDTGPGSVVVLQLNEAGRLLSPRAAALSELHRAQPYASSSQPPGDHATYSSRNGVARSVGRGGSSPPDTGTTFSSPAPHHLPFPPLARASPPDQYFQRQPQPAYAQPHPHQYQQKYRLDPHRDRSPPASQRIPPPPPPEHIRYSSHAYAPRPLSSSSDYPPRPAPLPPPHEILHPHGRRGSNAPAPGALMRERATSSAGLSAHARSSSSQSQSSEYAHAPGPSREPHHGYRAHYEREERYREPPERRYDDPRASGVHRREHRDDERAYAYPPRAAYAAHAPGYPPFDTPPPPAHHHHADAYARAPYYPHPTSDPRAYAHSPPPPRDRDHHRHPAPYDARDYGPPPPPPPPHHAHHYSHASSESAHSTPPIPPPPPVEWPDHPPRERRERARARGSGSMDSAAESPPPERDVRSPGPARTPPPAPPLAPGPGAPRAPVPEAQAQAAAPARAAKRPWLI